MKIQSKTPCFHAAIACSMAIVLTLASAGRLSAALVAWDTSTTAGVQNGNGTWGTDNFWTPYSGTGTGTTLNAWLAGDDAFFGRNIDGAGTPSGDFTVTVSGVQSASSIQQPSGGAGNFTLTGGAITLAAGTPIRADQGTFTVNSDITATGVLRMTGGQITLGGSNTFGNMSITASGTPILALTSSRALGSGNTLTVSSQSVTIDVRSTTIATTALTLANGLTITKILNTGAGQSSWGGNINAGTTAVVQAGGTTSQLDISGVISGGGGVNVEDGTILKLSGANLHTTTTTVRAGGTLIVGNNSALGTTAARTFVNTGSTLDLNGFNVGSEAITLQNANAKLFNNAVGSAVANGAITLGSTGQQIGGSGNLTLGGVISGSQGFEKVGGGVLTLGGTNTYSGTTTVSAGTLIVNGDMSGATGNLSVASGATLGGSGTIGGATTISGTHSPGNSPGVQTFGSSLTYSGTAPSVLWELTDNTTFQASPTPVFDQIIVNGNLDFAVPTTMTLNFAFTGSAVDWSNSLWDSDITGTSGWLVYDVGGTLSNFSNLTIATANWEDGQGDLFNDVRSGGSFTLYQSGNDIYLNYVVPEPSTYALLILAAAGLGGHVIRRRRRQADA